jgi:hypothetical protein
MEAELDLGFGYDLEPAPDQVAACLAQCAFCGLARSGAGAAFCTGCGRPLLAQAEVRSMDLTKTTANYDPYHPDWKPWREPTTLKKKSSKKKTETFYNKATWGKRVPRPPAIKPKPEDSKEGEEGEDRGELVFSDQHEYGGVRFRGFSWRKPGGGLLRRHRRRGGRPDEPFGKIIQ